MNDLEQRKPLPMQRFVCHLQYNGEPFGTVHGAKSHKNVGILTKQR